MEVGEKIAAVLNQQAMVKTPEAPPPPEEEDEGMTLTTEDLDAIFNAADPSVSFYS